MTDRQKNEQIQNPVFHYHKLFYTYKNIVTHNTSLKVTISSALEFLDCWKTFRAIQSFLSSKDQTTVNCSLNKTYQYIGTAKLITNMEGSAYVFWRWTVF